VSTIKIKCKYIVSFLISTSDIFKKIMWIHFGPSIFLIVVRINKKELRIKLEYYNFKPFWQFCNKSKIPNTQKDQNV